jgi:hypothetical protein
MTTNQMPQVSTSRLATDLTSKDYDIALLTLNHGHLRASKPTVKPEDDRTGIAAYAWRMAAFQISPIAQHHCMPVCADFDLPDGCRAGRSWFSLSEWEKAEAREYRKNAQAVGDRIADAIVNATNPLDWHGVIRWGQAFGVIGTPQVAPDGAIIYR